MKHYYYFFLLALSMLTMYSCSESIIVKQESLQPIDPQTKSTSYTNYTSQPMVLGEKLTNPYSVTMMQNAANALTKPGYPVMHIEPTDLYVRFLPKDSTDLNILYNIEGLELFDYPLDYEILEEGDYYHDPSLPENSPTWLYTTVKPNYKFPDIQYEILEECYIPDTEISAYPFSNNNSKNIISPEDLEREAYKLAGLDSMWADEENTKATASYPSGRFTVIDTETGFHEPIKGVKIRVHNFIKWATTYTDNNGYYYIGKKYKTNVHYAMIFQNSKGFKIWGNYAMLAPANHNMRFNSNTGISENFYSNSNAWDWATVNNVVYDYYGKCSQEGIMPPPSDLTIWCLRDKDWSSAIMIPHIKNVNISLEILNDFFFNIGISGSLLGLFLPDLFISTNVRQSNDIYGSVMHELSHASHFMRVESDYWNRYINYILNCWSHGQDTYGDGTLADNGLCAVGEMWGYAMEHIYEYEKYKGFINTDEDYPNDGTNAHFFHPDILWNIYKKGWLTKGDIFSCLNKEIDEVSEFRENMKYRFPEHAIKLDFEFASYGEYDKMGEWIIFNNTADTIFVDMYGGLPNMLTEQRISMQIIKDTNRIVLGHMLKPGESVKIAYLPYNSGNEFDFYDILEIEEISPSHLYLADKNGYIFQKAILDGSVKLFKKCGFWSENYDGDTYKWTFLCNTTDPNKDNRGTGTPIKPII